MNSRTFSRIVHSGRYQPELDGLRVLAIVPVLWSHTAEVILRVAQTGDPDRTAHDIWTNWVPRGFAGVHLFFVISGYVIALPFLRAVANGTTLPATLAFLSRRFWRLVPPYLIVIVTIYAFLTVTGYVPKATNSYEHVGGTLTESLLASVFYVHGFVFNAWPRLDPPGWTLEVEIHYYLLFALMIPVLAGRIMRDAWLVPALMVVFMGLAYATNEAAGPLYSTYFLTRYLQIFLLGVLIARLAITLKPPSRAESHIWDGAAFGGAAFYAWLCFWIERDLTTNGFREPVSYILFGLMFGGALRGNRFRQCLAWRPMAMLGGMTYSIYLIHKPLVQFAVWPAYRVLADMLGGPDGTIGTGLAFGILGPSMIVLALGSAAVFYQIVERPFMQGASRPARSQPEIAVATLPPVSER